MAPLWNNNPLWGLFGGYMEYYKRSCKNCLEVDCDDKFCCYECQVEYEEGEADYKYELYKDNQLMESDHAHEFANGCNL